MSKKIFVAIDDQVQSGRAADAAITIAGATSSALIFFMANPAVMPGRAPHFYRYTEDDIRRYFDLAHRRAKSGGLFDVKCITRECTDIATSILSEAEIEKADYIVIGSDRRRGPLARWKYSISQEVAAGAPCPTVIVHRELHRQREPTLVAAE